MELSRALDYACIVTFAIGAGIFLTGLCIRSKALYSESTKEKGTIILLAGFFVMLLSFLSYTLVQNPADNETQITTVAEGTEPSSYTRDTSTDDVSASDLRIGDIVYIISEGSDGELHAFPMAITGISDAGFSDGDTMYDLTLEDSAGTVYRNLDDFGSTVFLTRDEAEETIN